MQPVARLIFMATTWLFAAGLVVQVFLAGLGVFDDPASFATHRDFGYTLSLLPIVLVIAGFLGGVERRLIGLAGISFVLLILQSILVAFRTDAPAVAALHPVNGFAILLLALVLARSSWELRRAATT
jgi:hypothetical protein